MGSEMCIRDSAMTKPRHRHVKQIDLAFDMGSGSHEYGLIVDCTGVPQKLVDMWRPLEGEFAFSAGGSYNSVVRESMQV